MHFKKSYNLFSLTLGVSPPTLQISLNNVIKSTQLLNQHLSRLLEIMVTYILIKQKKVKLVAQLCPSLCNPMDGNLPGSSVHGNFSGKNTRVGSHALLQEIF